ncbi:MoaF-related domain-containing protein [Myroides sp. C15-4]|uniref:MoaF-related domain-containing protein n=1 Tax=Myroides sp. C15-4 TaxID=3400532 RepID=UPI003D2F7148
MMKKGVVLAMVAMGILSCSQKQESTSIPTTEVEESSFAPVTLIGKKGILTYPDFTAYMTYESENRLHWKTVTKEGEVAEGEETVSYKRINDHVFFLSWIEADGFTVSQVIDVHQGKVEAFLSFEEEESERGKRGSVATSATFTFAE